MREIWAALVLFELVLGELTLVFSYQRWTIEDPRPYPVGREFSLSTWSVDEEPRASLKEADLRKRQERLTFHIFFFPRLVASILSSIHYPSNIHFDREHLHRFSFR